MSFWSYPIKSSWESNDQQNMETQTLEKERGEEMENIEQWFHTNPGLTGCECRWAVIITMMAGQLFTSFTISFSHLHLQNKTKCFQLYLLIMGTIWLCGLSGGSWVSSHLWHNVYRQTEAWEKFLIMIPPVNVATFQMFINYRHADMNIQS